MKRRQSMDPKLSSSQQHSRNASTGGTLHSSSSTSWRSKLGSFLKKGNNALSDNESKGNVKSMIVHSSIHASMRYKFLLNSSGILRRSQSEDSMLSSHSSKPDDDDGPAERSSVSIQVSSDLIVSHVSTLVILGCGNCKCHSFALD